MKQTPIEFIPIESGDPRIQAFIASLTMKCNAHHLTLEAAPNEARLNMTDDELLVNRRYAMQASVRDIMGMMLFGEEEFGQICGLKQNNDMLVESCKALLEGIREYCEESVDGHGSRVVTQEVLAKAYAAVKKVGV